MLTVEEVSKNLKAQGAKKISKFTKAIRIQGLNSFEEGEVINIPNKEDWNIFETAIGNNKAECMVVTSTLNGVESTKVLYPSVFTRRLRIWNEDGTPTAEYASSTGSVATLFAANAVYEDAMTELAGKSIKCTKKFTCRTRQFNGTDIIDGTLYQFDIVE